MIRRGLVIGAEILAALMAIVVVTAGILVWRVAQGPVPLDFLTPKVERELDALHPEVTVAIGGTVLAWEGWPETFALRVRDVRLTDSTGQTARIPAVDLRLHVPALINGTVAPTRITTRGASLTLIRGPDGLRFGDPDAGTTPDGRQRDVGHMLPRVLDDLMAKPGPGRPLAYLRRLEIADAEIRVRDARLDTVWRAPDATLRLRKTDAGLAGRADLGVALGEQRVAMHVSVSYRAGADGLSVAGGFSNLHPPSLASEVDALRAARHLRLPISGSGVARIGLDGSLVWASGNLRAGAGDIAWPGKLPEPRPVREAEAALSLDAQGQHVRARDLRIAFASSDGEAPTITGRLDARRETDRGSIAVETKGAIANVAMDELAKYWPAGIQDEGIAREWVTTNVREGTVERAGFTGAFTLPGGDPDALRLDRLAGRMRYRDLSIRYLEGLEPVRDIAGTATFDKTKLQMDVAEGALRGVQVRSAKVTVSGLHLSDQFLEVDVDTTGPLQDSLTPLAQPRLDLLRELGLEPGQTRGSADVTLAFAFPLLKDLTMAQVDVQADATLSEVAVDDFVFGHGVRRGELDLSVNKTGMRMKGPVSLAGVPLNMDWRERFDEGASPMRRIDAQIPELTAADRMRLGRSTAPVLDGPVSVNLQWRGDGKGTGTLRAATNLKDASLDLAALKWRKPPGTPGQASFELQIRDETPVRLEQFDVVAGGGDTPKLETGGRMRFDRETGRIARASLDAVTLGGTELRQVDATRTATGWRMTVAGGHVDARPYLSDLGMPQRENGPGSSDDSPPSLNIETGRLDYVRLADGRRLKDVRLRVRRNVEGRWPEVRVRAVVPERFLRDAERDGGDAAGPPIAIDYAPRDDGRRKLVVVAANAGASLRALGLVESVTGGRLRLEGLTRRAKGGSPIDAELQVTDFKVRDAPVLARLLTVALISGIDDVLRGEGLNFQRLTGDLVIDGSRVSTDLLHAYGPALGITAKGNVDIGAGTADLTGVLVPAALVNRVLGSIPLLGNVITGGEGEGLFAVTYGLKGDLRDPEIRVNPLSVLAPGFLRGLFERSDDGGTGPPRAIPDEAGPAPNR